MIIKLLYRIIRKIDPYAAAKMMEMQVGKGIIIAGKRTINFGTEPYLIRLDDEVRLAGEVVFITHDGGTWTFRDMPEYKAVVSFAPIHVGFRSFIGYRAIIMPGVKIGKRCIIGAGAIVTKDIPDNSIAVGVPARVIGSIDDFAKRKMEISNLLYQKGFDKNRKKHSLISAFGDQN